MSSKVDMANPVTPPIWDTYIWVVCAWLLWVMNGHLNDTCSNDIGQYAQNKDIILESIMSILGRTYVNIHFDLLKSKHLNSLKWKCL